MFLKMVLFYNSFHWVTCTIPGLLVPVGVFRIPIAVCIVPAAALLYICGLVFVPFNVVVRFTCFFVGLFVIDMS